MTDAVQMLGSLSVQNAMAARPKALTGTARSEAALNQAAKEFEAVFMAQMLQPMWEGVEVDETFGGGHGEELLRSLLVQEFGKSVAEGANTGLADSIKAEMIRLQASRETGAIQ